MTRSYAHRPDEDWTRWRFPRQVVGIATVQQTIVRLGDSLHAGIIDAGVDAAMEAVAEGWYLEEPVELLHGYLADGAAFVRHALTLPIGAAPELSSLTRWTAVAVVAGDLDLAAQVGARVPPVPEVEQPGDEFDFMLAALARGDDQGAMLWAKRLAEALADPGTAPFTVRGFAHLGEIAVAVLGGDQGALELAMQARNKVVVASYRRTVQGRRTWYALVDHYAAAPALLGVGRRLRLPDDVPSVPAGLFGRT